MYLIFDAKILSHSIYTGIENYTKYILKNISDKTDINIQKPTTTNRYLAHLWTHFILPFKSGDILYCPANIAPIFVPKNKKLIITIHDVAFLTYKKSFSKFFYLYYSSLIPFNIKRADEIITVSTASKKEIIKFFPYANNKITVIPLGIDKKYKIKKDLKKKKQILYVGSINERKNIIGVIESFEKLPKELDYTLVLIGNFFNIFSLSNKMKKTLARAKKNSKITFKQGLDDESLIYEYNISSIFILPSFYEGFGLPLLEAMACGTPIITSRISSMPEVCGDAALYVNPYDIEEISNKLKMLIDDKDLQEELVQKGLEKIKGYTWGNAANAHVAIFQKLHEDRNNNH